MTNKQIWAYTALVSLISRLVLLAVAVYTNENFEIIEAKKIYWNYSDNYLLNLLGYWDTGYYLRIAEIGYPDFETTKDPNLLNNWGFFPFYSMLIYPLGLLLGDNVLAGVLISNACWLGAGFLIWKIAAHMRPDLPRLGLYSLIGLNCLPTSYLGSGVFSESIFLFLSLWSVWAYLQEKFVVAGLAGMFLALSRPFGVLLTIPFFIDYIRKYELRKSVLITLILGLIPFGTFLFFGYCWYRTGDFWLYVEMKERMWGINTSNPFAIIWNMIFRGEDNYLRFNMIYAVAMMLFTAYGLRRQAPMYLLWALILIFMPIIQGAVNIVSMPRYTLAAFPVSLAVGIWVAEYKWGWLVYPLLAALNIWLCMHYIIGHQFAC